MHNKEVTTAVFKNNMFKHFGVSKLSASLYGDKIEDIIQVEISIAEDQKKPTFVEQRGNKSPDYWGWFDSEKQKFTLIFQQLFLLEMCFPYGPQAEEERNRGKAYRLNVKKV